MERLRSINLRIGFAAAILFAIFAFNWTSERKAIPVFEEEAYPTELTLKPFTVNQPRQESLPKTTVLKPNDLIVEVPDLAIGFLPSTIPVDSSSSSDDEVGNIGPPVAPSPPTKSPAPEEPENHSPIWVIVEEMPVFNGCDQEGFSKKEKQECTTNKLLTYLYSKIKYPEIARQNGVEGTVYIKFIIEKDGSVNNAAIIRDIGGGCGEEALRVVNSMPKWTPGRQRMVPVRVQFSLPVMYKLD